MVAETYTVSCCRTVQIVISFGWGDNTHTNLVPIIFSTTSVVYEVLCLALTLYKTLGNYRHGRAAGIHTPFASLLLRDGEHPLCRAH